MGGKGKAGFRGGPRPVGWVTAPGHRSEPRPVRWVTAPGGRGDRARSHGCTGLGVFFMVGLEQVAGFVGGGLL